MGKNCEGSSNKLLDLLKAARSNAYNTQKKAGSIVSQSTPLRQDEISFKMQSKRHSLL